MQVWMTCYHGFLLETVGLLVDKAELFFLFWATNCHFPSSGLELKPLSERTRSSRDLGRRIIS